MPQFFSDKYFISFQNTGTINRLPNGFQVAVDEEQFRVEVIRPDILRLKISQGGVFDEKPTFAACFDEEAARSDVAAADAFQIEETDSTITLSTELLRLVVSRTPFALRLERADGTRLFESSAASPDGGTKAYRFLNDEFANHCEQTIHYTGGQYTEYVFAGPSLPQVLDAYTSITGRMAAPPVWSLGFHQCRWHPYTQESFLDVARQYRERGIPCDTLWLDIHYMDDYRVFTWDKERFPDVPGMLAQLQDDQFRVITIIDPGVKYDPGYPVFDEGKANNYFCKTENGQTYIGQVWPGRTAFPDFVKEDVRAWWGRLNAEHVESGLAGIWNDMNEPATGEVPCKAMRFDHDGADYSHERIHNQYAMLMAMGTAAGLRTALPDLRPFILSRAGFAGMQRYSAHWMGDNLSRWDHLEMSIKMSLGFGLSGQPFNGADIGGFALDSNPELLARWTQYGALTPFCRNHAALGTRDQYPWSFGPGVENICREAIRLRYRLMPYLYTTFMQASETGAPIMRPLVYDFQNDRTAAETEDQYLLGEALLVAPIYKPGVTSRHVYLPEGEWARWLPSESQIADCEFTYWGSQYVQAEAPLESIPVYLRAGYVVPLNDPVTPTSTMNHQPETIKLLLLVPERDGCWLSQLHEDDGTSKAHERGACYRTIFRVERTGKKVSITSAVKGEGYPEFKRTAFDLQLTGDIELTGISSITVNGTKVEPTDQPGLCTIPNTGESFTVEVVLAESMREE